MQFSMLRLKFQNQYTVRLFEYDSLRFLQKLLRRIACKSKRDRFPGNMIAIPVRAEWRMTLNHFTFAMKAFHFISRFKILWSPVSGRYINN